MKAAELVVGGAYTYREKSVPLSPVQKVTLLEKLRRKARVRIRFDDGEFKDLVDYATTRQLVARWAEVRTLVHDEQRARRLKEHAANVADSAIAVAASAVLQSTGETGVCVRVDVTSMSVRELGRICDRAGLEPFPEALHPLGFEDRHGQVHLPLDGILTLAQAFAAAEPDNVTRHIDHEEEELRLRGNTPGDRWWHAHLRDKSPGLALARRWAGITRDVETLQAEVVRLRALASIAACDLKMAGQERTAQRLLRALERD